MNTTEPQVTVSARYLMDRDLWDRACDMLGLNPWAVNEGLMDSGDTVTLSSVQAAQLGLLGGPLVTPAEAALAASEVVSLTDLRRFMEAFHEVWRDNPERGHNINDDIRERVLRMCAAGHPDAALLAREVLVTSEWDDVSSWSA